jgi:predicted esterase
VKGLLVKQDAAEVVFNPYWSPNPAMTYEVVRLPADAVKKVEVEPHPEPEFFRRLAARKPGDTKALLDLGAYAKEAKLKAHAEMAFALAAVEAPADPLALAAVGGAARLATLKKGNALLDADLLTALKAYAAEPDAAARQKAALDLKAKGFAAKPEDLERYRRSALQPKGRHDDVPLSLHADRYAGAVYTLFVPPTYDPALPWPLLIGLHGGGADGKAGDEVVGSGDSAMNFYADQAAQHGVLVACPNAQMAQWHNKINEDLVRDVIAEMRLLYNVDVDRIHLTGHSMGGYGTWDLGPKMAELFATVSPAAGQGSGVERLIETRTPIFIYHSDDDYVSVDTDRQAAKRLRESDLDFIYTEIPKQGHGYPDSVRRELFEFLLPRRNYDPAHKDAWPRSSLWGKVTPEEKAYLGDPLALAAPPTLDEWLQCVRMGGGRARTAVAALVDAKPAGVVEGLVKIVKDEKAAPYGRAEAARALGLLKDVTAAPALRKALEAPATRLGSVVATAAARALAALPDPEPGEAFAKGVEAWTLYFEDKVAGSGMRFSDWQRSVGTLAAVVEAWAAVPGKDVVAVLDRTVVARVLAASVKVETSERVPQDPSAARTALAKAVATAYAKAKAPDARWNALLEALSSDPKARAAAESARS